MVLCSRWSFVASAVGMASIGRFSSICIKRWQMELCEFRCCSIPSWVAPRPVLFSPQGVWAKNSATSFRKGSYMCLFGGVDYCAYPECVLGGVGCLIVIRFLLGKAASRWVEPGGPYLGVCCRRALSVRSLSLHLLCCRSLRTMVA